MLLHETRYAVSEKTQEVLNDYGQYIAGGFAPLPVALVKAKNSQAWDVDGKEYIDMLSMFSVVNMGHSHPKIVRAMSDVIQDISVVNLPFHNPWYGRLSKRLYEVLGYDQFVGMTSGGEACDAAVKIARKWAFVKKGIPAGTSHILTAAACYHGVTLSTVSMASRRAKYFGQYLPNCGPTSPSGVFVQFGVIEDLEKALKVDAHRIAAFMVEPIQGAAGIIVPPEDYIKRVAQLCRQHHVLFIADEVQTGLGRAGSLLCHFQSGEKADLVVLGKAISGGMCPVSGVMGPREILSLISPYEIGCTMANNPPGCAAAIAALDVLVEERLSERAMEMGQFLFQKLSETSLPHVTAVDGRGMFWALAIDQKAPKVTGRRITALLAQRGVLANATGSGHRIRVCPPLTIEKEVLRKGVDVIIGALKDVENIPIGDIPGETI